MHPIKTPHFLRPSSRSSSTPPLTNKVDSALPSSERSRPLSKLSLTSFRRPSPPVAASFAPVTLVHDGSYLEVLSLKLGEAVSKVLAQPASPSAVHEQLDGRRPIPAGRGIALGSFIAAEIQAAGDHLHLQKAIIRCLNRPLSTLLYNISARLLPLIASPAFGTINLVPHTHHFNPTQIHALAFATLAGEVLEFFDELGLGSDHEARLDGLRGTREGLVSLVNRTVKPLILGIQNEITPLIDQLENVPSSNKSVPGSNSKVPKATVTYHPSIASLQIVLPFYAKALTKIAAIVPAQTVLATMLIGLVWHGLVALSHRVSPVASPPSSPPLTPVVARVRNRLPQTTTPPTTPPPTRFSMKLPPSRPSTPPGTSAVPTQAGDARALYELLNLLPFPSKENSTTLLAREAMDEAFEGLVAFVALLELIQVRGTLTPTTNVDHLESELELVTEVLPTLIGLPIMLQTYGYNGLQDDETRSVASMIGMTEDEYRENCLGGFNRADECEEVVGQHVIRILRTDYNSDGASLVAKWLEKQTQE